MSILRLFARLGIVIILFGATPQAGHAKGACKSDSEIAQILIKQSIARYSGVCPCPTIGPEMAQSAANAQLIQSQAGHRRYVIEVTLRPL